MAIMLTLDQRTGLIREAHIVASPNFDARPADCAPNLIVVHGISLPPGQFGGPWIDLLFTNQLPAGAHPYFANIADARVSAHFLIRRDGQLIQYVPVDRRAWHAGESCYQGRSCCNDYSIGIELEGQDNETYLPQQYDRLAAIIRVLSRTFPGISSDRIRGHSDIAPGRKTDPGEAFDWLALNERLATLST